MLKHLTASFFSIAKLFLSAPTEAEDSCFRQRDFHSS